MPDTPKPVVLIVRDGWGENPHPEHDAFNAVKLAKTPVTDAELLAATVRIRVDEGTGPSCGSGTIIDAPVIAPPPPVGRPRRHWQPR